MRTFRLAALALLLPILVFRAAPAWAAQTVRADHVTLDISLEAPVRPGATVWAAIRQTIEPGWHTYWSNPGDSGLATSITWLLPRGVTAGQAQLPVPERFVTGPVVNFGYRNIATTLVPLRASANSDISGKAQAKLFLLECAQMCIPEQVTLDLDLLKASGSPQLFASARAALPTTLGGPARLTVDPKFLSIAISDPRLARANAATAQFFPSTSGAVDYDAKPVMRIDGDTLTWKARRPAGSVAVNALEGVLSIPGAGGFIVSAARSTEAMPQAPAADLSLLEAAVMAFLGGLILNLMPCVLPILSMKALALARTGGSTQALRRDGVYYFVGVLSTFMSIAALLLALKAGGAALGWGFQLQSPLFVFALALLMAAVGMNLLGAFELPLSLAGVGHGLTRTEGGRGAFFTGMLAVLVASPCTAPFMGTAVGYALTQPASFSIAVFAALGIGFALPFSALAFASPLMRLIPRPGPWMLRLREFLAFPMFATAIWLFWVLGQQVGTTGLAVALSIGLGLVFLFWLLPQLHLWRRPVAALGLAALIAAGSQIGAATAPSGWQPWSPQALADARREGKPVLVDFTAAWCVTCLVNERVTLGNSEVVAGLQRHGVVLLRGDWTNRDAAISAELSRHGRSGVPLYLLYPAGTQGRAIVLPQLLTPGGVLGAIDRLQIAQVQP